MEKYYDLKQCKYIPISLPVGYYVLVEVTTLAANSITVKLTGGEHTYFECTRQSIDPLPVESGYFESDSEELRLSVDIPQSSRVDARVVTTDFNSQNALLVRAVTVIGEDQDDEDYNDFLVNLTIMRSGR